MENTIPKQSTFRRLLLLLALILYSSLHSLAQTVTIDNVVYSISDSVATVTGLENKSLTTELIIPDSIEYNDTTYPVTSIGNFAFNMCEGLTSVTIGNSVSSIGNCAFSSCTGLINVTLGNSLNSIGSQAFSGCAALTSVSIPNSVISIGGFAFSDCSSLESVTIGSSVSDIYYGAFWSCNNIKNISSYNTTPPLCDGNVFSDYIFKNATVYVPEESIDAYKNAKVWEKFANIEPLSDYDAVPDVITSTDDTSVTVENGAISVMGSDLVQIVTLSGTTIYCGSGEARIEVIPGIYIVTVGAKVTKLAVK